VHVRISLDDGEYRITDTKNSTGTYVNGRVCCLEEQNGFLFGSSYSDRRNRTCFRQGGFPVLPDLTGYKLAGKYTLERSISNGSRTAMYRARRKAGDLVALKILSPQLTSSPESLEEFMHEVRLAGRPVSSGKRTLIMIEYSGNSVMVKPARRFLPRA